MAAKSIAMLKFKQRLRCAASVFVKFVVPPVCIGCCVVCMLSNEAELQGTEQVPTAPDRGVHEPILNTRLFTVAALSVQQGHTAAQNAVLAKDWPTAVERMRCARSALEGLAAQLEAPMVDAPEALKKAGLCTGWQTLSNKCSPRTTFERLEQQGNTLQQLTQPYRWMEQVPALTSLPALEQALITIEPLFEGRTKAMNAYMHRFEKALAANYRDDAARCLDTILMLIHFSIPDMRNLEKSPMQELLLELTELSEQIKRAK